MPSSFEGPVNVLRVWLPGHEPVRVDDHDQPSIVRGGEPDGTSRAA
ncbi:MAG: hypothetical protein QOD35_2181, partial [Nocardioidaceae bacterium]|nr:hypothetical protein [Nocardioidaceae bacterium]